MRAAVLAEDEEWTEAARQRALKREADIALMTALAGEQCAAAIREAFEDRYARLDAATGPALDRLAAEANEIREEEAAETQAYEHALARD
jgi:hypothetical protein